MSLENPTHIEIQLFQIACAFSREKLIVGAIWFGFSRLMTTCCLHLILRMGKVDRRKFFNVDSRARPHASPVNKVVEKHMKQNPGKSRTLPNCKTAPRADQAAYDD